MKTLNKVLLTGRAAGPLNYCVDTDSFFPLEIDDVRHRIWVPPALATRALELKDQQVVYVEGSLLAGGSVLATHISFLATTPHIVAQGAIT